MAIPTHPEPDQASISAAVAWQRRLGLRAPPPVTDPRYLSVSGRLIRTHRALRHLDFTLARLLSMVLLPLAFVVVLLVCWPWVQKFWSARDQLLDLPSG